MSHRFRPRTRPDLTCIAALTAIGLSFTFPASRVNRAARADDAPVAAVKMAREFLGDRDDERRAKLAAQLAEYDDRIDEVIAKLRRRSHDDVETGYLPDQKFTTKELRHKHPKDRLYYMIPPDYSAEKPTGLIVFMHGGGRTSKRTWPKYYLNKPDRDPSDGDRSQVGDLFAKSGMIAVGPSAPKDTDSWARWCLPEADEYLRDVILECKNRFNIDDDRVFLIGHSMGGFGAYHHIQRSGDRYAGVVVSSGSWQRAHLPAFRGTKLDIIHGVDDSDRGSHFTDIAYARRTDELLSKLQLNYTYHEHDGDHGIASSRETLTKYLANASRLKRDPFYPHITLASPVGFTSWYFFPVRHNRWLTLDVARPGSIEYDRLYADFKAPFDDWKLEHSKIREEGQSIEAKIDRDSNRIDVKTQNVARFTIWLHPKMVDFDERVTVVVDGKTLFRDRVASSLVTTLESYERRQDWGLLYQAKITLTLE